MEFNALVYLQDQAFIRGAVTGMESPVITIGTTACSRCSVAVGTGKAGINDHLLQTCSVFVNEIPRKRLVSLHDAKVKSMSCQIKDLP
ncbi:MAG: hypothetical protein BWX93_01904 [Bacteroidetes bacterium ADurb.Bin139]|nr:MAG: hypothetical protein BWX93_01904 [Bacteroidetes bacterium ADurb.Bin139]